VYICRNRRKTTISKLLTKIINKALQLMQHGGIPSTNIRDLPRVFGHEPATIEHTQHSSPLIKQRRNLKQYVKKKAPKTLDMRVLFPISFHFELLHF
jgi:hypothetical protein